MSTLTTFLVTIAGLLLTMLGIIVKQDVSVEIRKTLAWIVTVIITLLLPSFLITWLTMQIVARLLAPTFIDLSEFTSQVSLWTASVSMIYPLTWGVWLSPQIRRSIRDKLLAPSKPRKDVNSSSKIRKDVEK